MNKLTRLTLNTFRNVRPTTLEFRPGINVLLGKNAAGKTTLLRLLSTLLGAPDEALQDDPFEASYLLSHHPLEIEHHTKKARSPEPVPTVEITRMDRPQQPLFQRIDSFRCKLGESVIEVEANSNTIRIEHNGDARTFARPPYWPPLAATISVLVQEGEYNDLNELTEALSNSDPAAVDRLDESLEWFNKFLRTEIRKQGMTTQIHGWPLPRSLIKATLLNPSRDATSIVHPWDFLDRAAAVLDYEQAHARFDVQRLVQAPERQTVLLNNLRLFFKRADEEISHDLLSYGQKRLLAFFAYADASPDIVVADELVNGLHHDWITACLDEIGPRQAFLTSQNPLLLDFLRFDDAEEVRRTFIFCERSATSAGVELIWRNPTEDEAEDFFLAYQTGIQRVSDILLTKGFW